MTSYDSPLAKLLKRRSNHSTFAYNAIPSGPYVCQVTANDRSALDNHLPIQDYVLGSAKDGLPTDFVPGCLQRLRNFQLRRLKAKYPEFKYRLDIFVPAVVSIQNFHVFIGLGSSSFLRLHTKQVTSPVTVAEQLIW